MRALLTALLCSCLLACAAAPVKPTQKDEGSPRFARGRVANVVGADVRSDGIALKLDYMCARTVMESYCKRESWADGRCQEKGVLRKEELSACDWSRYEEIELTLTPPWSRQALAAPLGRDRSVRFAVDWSKVGVDPLNADARKQLAHGWLVAAPSTAAFEWKPSERSLNEILAKIGDATGTELDVGRSDGPVTLSVRSFTVYGGSLRAGQAARLRLIVRNAGTGKAYRVVARTRSGIPALHRLQFSFGTLKPGEDKTRELTVNVPDTVTEESALILLMIEDANRNPARHKQRFAIVAAERRDTPRTASCPAGVLTLHQYKAKVERIKTMLENRAINRQEFDDYEAELLACLE
jgi:hypothetical protein